MKVERDLAGFALPFAGGVFISAYAGSVLTVNPETGAAASFTAVGIFTFLLLHPHRRDLDGHTVRIIIAFLALSTGIFCCLSQDMIDISHVKSSMELSALKAGKRMQAMIDSIPFTDNDSNAIAKALITGERCDIPIHIRNIFRESGASHILALSGLHLGIIHAIVTRLLSCVGNTGKAVCTRSVISILLCGFYTMATGAGSSIVRAFLFILLAETARLMHRYKSTGQILLSALIIQLAVSPQSIRSVGFQLSYAAMTGIAFILPVLKSWWPGSIYKDRFLTKNIRKIWNAAAMSISCQITTGPIAYMYFGTFPVHFLITNLIALPLTGILIPFILMTIILQAAGLCPHFVIRLTETLIKALTGSLDIITWM